MPLLLWPWSGILLVKTSAQLSYWLFVTFCYQKNNCKGQFCLQNWFRPILSQLSNLRTPKWNLSFLSKKTKAAVTMWEKYGVNRKTDHMSLYRLSIISYFYQTYVYITIIRLRKLLLCEPFKIFWFSTHHKLHHSSGSWFITCSFTADLENPKKS